MAFEGIQFDPNSVPLVSDLRVLATIRTPGSSDLSIYLDSNGEKQGIRRADYISETNEPGLFKRDEVSVVSNWLRFGGPHVVILPEGQRLLLGELPQGMTVEVALWRTFIMAQTFSNRILVAATPSGISAFQPKPGSATSLKSEPLYKSITQERDVLRILDSVSEKPIVLAVADAVETEASPSYIEVAPDSEEISELPNEIKEIQPPTEVESIPEPEPEPEPEIFVTEVEAAPAKKSGRLLLVISDLLITFALLAFMYAGYQTLWTKFIAAKQTAIVRSEIEVKWNEAPAAAPELHKGFALIYIPRLKDKVWGLPLTEGVDPQDLTSGLGHYVDTEMPGLEGNFAIAGHRSTYGEPLANIDQLQQDDKIYIKTGQNWFTYKLLMTAIVEPDEMWVIEDNPGGLVNKTGNKEMITITTCDPRWGSTHRWIWWGTLEKVSYADDVPEAIGAVQ